jgi:hypothetical protein
MKAAWLMWTLAAGLFFAAAAGLWAPVGLSGEVVQKGNFEDHGGRILLALTPLERDMVPTVDVAGGVLRVPPGNVVVLPLDEPFVARAAEGAPWFAVGDRAPGPDGGMRVDEAQRLGPNGLSQGDWSEPWSAFAAGRDALEASCGAELVFDGVRLALGPCSATWGGQSGVVALAAGPEWLTVERAAGFGEVRQAIPAAAALLGLVSLIAAALLAWSLGPPAAVSTAVVVLVSSFLSPVAGPLGLIGAWAVGWLAGVGKAVRERVGRAAPWLLAAVLPLGAPLVLAEDEPEGVVADAACTITGYSTAEGHGLRDGTPNPAERLRQRCGTCASGVDSLAWGGKRFDFVRDQLCGSDAPMDGKVVVFVGGGNDDLLWGIEDSGLASVLARPLAQLRALSGALSGPEASGRFYAAGAAATRAGFDAQRLVIEEGLSCLKRRGGRLVFVQDVLAPDLAGGRAPDRAWMASERRRLVEDSGGAWVDLGDVFAADGGVWAFSDFIHLSGAGHDRLSSIVCDRIEAPAHGTRGVTPDAPD